MVQIPRPKVAAIRRDGGSWSVTLPREELHRLGWNLGDLLVFTVVESSLVMTRVEMPKVADLRKTSPS